MKINFVSYFDPFHYRGGGEMVTRDLIETGRARGHEVSVSAVRPRSNRFSESAHLDMVADVFNFPATFRSLGAWRAFSEEFLRMILKRKRFVHFNNAYVDICNLPYLPCSGHSANPCPHKVTTPLPTAILRRDFSPSCYACRSLTRALFQDARLSVFVSPLHQELTLKVLADVASIPCFVLKPTIDGSVFYNRNLISRIDHFKGATADSWDKIEWLC
jgi:hypothetical protein